MVVLVRTLPHAIIPCWCYCRENIHTMIGTALHTHRHASHSCDLLADRFCAASVQLIGLYPMPCGFFNPNPTALHPRLRAHALTHYPPVHCDLNLCSDLQQQAPLTLHPTSGVLPPAQAFTGQCRGVGKRASATDDPCCTITATLNASSAGPIHGELKLLVEGVDSPQVLTYGGNAVARSIMLVDSKGAALHKVGRRLVVQVLFLAESACDSEYISHCAFAGQAINP